MKPKAWIAVALLLAQSGCTAHLGYRLAPAAAAPFAGRLDVLRVDASTSREPERRHDRSVQFAAGRYYANGARLSSDGTRLVRGDGTVLFLSPDDRLELSGSFCVGERTPDGGTVVRSPVRAEVIGLSIAATVLGGGLLTLSGYGFARHCSTGGDCRDPFDAPAALLSVGIGASAGLLLAGAILLVNELAGRFTVDGGR